ncbi:MAG: AMP-binding protein [Actinomycetota bacterium]
MALLTHQFAADRPDDVALADDHGSVTFAGFDERVNRIVHALRDAGLGGGGTIGIVCGNRNEWFELAMACAHAGVTYVPINWHLVGPEIAYILADSGATAVVTEGRFADAVTTALTDERVADQVSLRLAVGGEVDGFTPFDDFVATGSPDEPEGQLFGGPMFYTSGTTGNPKGVKSSLTAMPDGTGPEIWQLVGAGFADMVKAPGTTVLCGPVYHSAQWAFSFLPMIVGSATVMQHKYDSAAVLDLIDRHQATNMHLVPTQMKRLLDLPDDAKAGFDGSSLQLVIHGAAPCPTAVKQGLIEWWGPKITEYYGSTEGSIISLIDSEQWLAKGGSVGPPLPHMEVTIVDDDGNVCPPNVPGTVWFRNAMGTDFEYHNAPDKTADSHSGHGATTGDVGYLDDDGYLWLSDRKIDMIISGGVNIYPAEIESVIGGDRAVADVAVIGVPNDEFGEEVKAMVVLDPDAPDRPTDDDAARAHLDQLCRTQLAGYKVPRSYEFLDELPRTGTGKVKKAILRAPFWDDADRTV